MDYTVGFLFNQTRDRVALIRKNKPEWQAGKLNGIGGKVEFDEMPAAAQVREFNEEAGVLIDRWRHFAVLSYRGGKIFFYEATGDLHSLITMTDEVIEIVAVEDIPDEITIPNLRWLIPLALDKDKVTAKILDLS